MNMGATGGQIAQWNEVDVTTFRDGIYSTNQPAALRGMVRHWPAVQQGSASAGRRRFTLFPPEQLPNLYPAPLDITLAGVPVSMVTLQDPDFERYPRFRQALAAAKVIELETGDALFIPYGWWHHVESLMPFNVLVNYWWNDRPPVSSPADCLLHGLLALRSLPPAERVVWRNLFDYYVFQTHGDPLAHLARKMRGLMGATGPEQFGQMKAILLRSLSRR